jgi:hypothetical protein
MTPNVQLDVRKASNSLMRDVLRLATAFVTLYRSWLYNPRKDVPTLSKTSTKRLVSSLGPPLPGSTGFLQMRAVQSTFIGYDADAGLLYPHLYILFFVICDDGMTRNRLQEKVVYPTIGELMESKIKLLDPHGRVVCTMGQALYALLAQASSVPVDGRSITLMANAVAHCSCV